MRAIILDAGEGKRLRPLTVLKPKCLLKLDGTTILEHQLLNLRKCGVKRVIIVVGYRANQIIEEVKRKKIDLEIEFIKNPIYYKTNTVYSLWLAKKHIKHDFIYLNGDVVFHEEVLKRVINSHHSSCIAVEKKKVSKEEVKVQLRSDMVCNIGKRIEESKSYGEFIGIAKFSEVFNKMFIKKLDEVVNEGKISEFFEEALNRTLENCKLYAIDVSDLPCIEIDTHEDLSKAKEIYLKLLRIGRDEDD